MPNNGQENSSAIRKNAAIAANSSSISYRLTSVMRAITILRIGPASRFDRRNWSQILTNFHLFIYFMGLPGYCG
jgi:hypothetical protein